MIYAIGYFKMGHPGYVKFGRARNPYTRVRELQTGCPLHLELWAAVDLDDRNEFRIHSAFSEYRLRGEWFSYEGDVGDFVQILIEPIDVEQKKKNAIRFLNQKMSKKAA